MTIAMEDDYNDVLGKAISGLGLDPAQVAAQAGLTPAQLERLVDGELDEAALRRVAPPLGLGTEALIALAHRTYRPEVTRPDGLAMINSPYADFFVNAYLLWDVATKQAVVFDTGSDGEAILRVADEHGLTIECILLTHTHHDHIMALDELRRQTGAPAFVSVLEPTGGTQPLDESKPMTVGRLTIEPRRTSGHTVGGTSFYVTGLSVPVVVVGDALFAGSMGRGNVSFPDALTNNRRQIFTLPDETIICPGHGPLTTVGLEKRHNPFYPEFTAAG